MAVSQLAYLGIGVSDLARWRTFASDVLGMQVVEGASDGGVYLRMDECHHRIVLHPSGEDDVVYVGLQAASHAEYEQSKEALRAAGVRITPGTPAEITQRRVLDLVKFETGEVPFELCVGLYTRWDPPFRPGRSMSGFKTGALGFGHVVLRSTTRDDSVRLLTETLGFRISDYIGTMVFLHCNPRHHSIAFQPAAKDLPRSRDKRMWHFMLETNSLDDVGAAMVREARVEHVFRYAHVFPRCIAMLSSGAIDASASAARIACARRGRAGPARSPRWLPGMRTPALPNRPSS